MSNRPRVVIYTSSLFAWPCIQALHEAGYLIGVITPDPQQQTGHQAPLLLLLHTLKMHQVPFEAVCKDNLTLIPSHLAHFDADIALCMTFSHLLPKEVLQHYPLGIYNCHASSLPAYIGRDPIYWQLRNQETHSALTWHAMSEYFDQGAIVSKLELIINSEDTYASLTQRFAYLALESLMPLLDHVCKNPVTHTSSLHEVRPMEAPAHIVALDFNSLDGYEIDALTRASNGHFGRVMLEIKGIDVELIQATVVDYPSYGTPAGTVVMVSQTQGLIVNTKQGCIRLDIVACELGVLSGDRLAQLINLDAGEQLLRSTHCSLQHA